MFVYLHSNSVGVSADGVRYLNPLLVMRSLTPAYERKGLVLTMQDEIWKDVVGYEGMYQVSNLGRVRRCLGNRFRYLRIHSKVRGYYYVSISKNGIAKKIRVHQLVAQAFIPNPNNKPCIDHINAIKTDNRVENLRWVTHKENTNNPLTIQSISASKMGDKNPMYGKKYTDDERMSISQKMKALLKDKVYNVTPEYCEKMSVYANSKKHAIRSNKPVIQLDGHGNIVGEYVSAREAARRIGVHPSCINNCCKGIKKRIKGFVWKYAENKDELIDKIYNRDNSNTQTT